jgi:two-component system, OmpR family, phosphate regulon sensor histidine kinase PhoR
VLLVLTGGVIARFAVTAASAREAIAALGGDEAPTIADAGPFGGGVWRALLRLARGWRERAQSAEERLADAEAVIAAVPDPLILVDGRRRIVRANAAAEPFVGALATPRDLATALRNPALLAAADAVLQGVADRVVEFADAVPNERQLRAHLARLRRPALDGAVAVLGLHDITALKRAEQLRADFIANASHELRTPLAALTGFIETLRGPARDDAEAHERFLAIMQEQAARMARLVDDLLALSAIELNEHVAPTGRVALAPLLREVAAGLELRAGERGMRIVLDLPAGVPEIVGNRDELAQVFQNLLDNAIKYGRTDGTITVAAEAIERPPPEGGAALPFVAVAVRDQGDGIPREHLPRLTERFYRVDTARSRAMGGTGLGLAIVKHVLNHHRGFLEVDSTLDEGSVFTAHLRPAAPHAEGQSASQGPTGD